MWKLPEMQVALLGAVLSMREEWTKKRRPSDRELVRRLQTQGAFRRWKEDTLLVELSRAWRWFWSEAGTIWFEQEQARRESEAVNLSSSNPGVMVAAADEEDV